MGRWSFNSPLRSIICGKFSCQLRHLHKCHMQSHRTHTHTHTHTRTASSCCHTHVWKWVRSSSCPCARLAASSTLPFPLSRFFSLPVSLLFVAQSRRGSYWHRLTSFKRFANIYGCYNAKVRSNTRDRKGGVDGGVAGGSGSSLRVRGSESVLSICVPECISSGYLSK